MRRKTTIVCMAIAIVIALPLIALSAIYISDKAKMKKQMGYADAKQIPWVAIVGSNEMETNTVMLKNMLTGEQTLVSLEALQAQIGG